MSSSPSRECLEACLPYNIGKSNCCRLVRSLKSFDAIYRSGHCFQIIIHRDSITRVMAVLAASGQRSGRSFVLMQPIPCRAETARPATSARTMDANDRRSLQNKNGMPECRWLPAPPTEHKDLATKRIAPQLLLNQHGQPIKALTLMSVKPPASQTRVPGGGHDDRQARQYL